MRSSCHQSPFGQGGGRQVVDGLNQPYRAAGSHCMTRIGYIVDPCCMEHRDASFGFDPRCGCKVRHCWHALNGQIVRQLVVGFNQASVDVQKVYFARGSNQSCNLYPLFNTQSPGLYSSAVRRMPTTKPGPTLSRTASITSIVRRNRFSSAPP